jgi:hypothetical protein
MQASRGGEATGFEHIEEQPELIGQGIRVHKVRSTFA